MICNRALRLLLAPLLFAGLVLLELLLLRLLPDENP